MTFYIYWKNQTGGPPAATINAASVDQAMKQFKRESPYLIREDQMSVESKLRS